jgi:hypothetical protein
VVLKLGKVGRLLALKWGQDLILELVLVYVLKLALVPEWGLKMMLLLNWTLELVLVTAEEHTRL